MKPFIDHQMLQDATRRWRSSKATKQTRSRRCKTFKCCEMVLDDEKVTKRDLVVASTRHHRARLLKYYPRRPCAPRPITNTFPPFQQIFFVLVCALRVPPRVLASRPKPCGATILQYTNRKIWVLH